MLQVLFECYPYRLLPVRPTRVRMEHRVHHLDLAIHASALTPSSDQLAKLVSSVAYTFKYSPTCLSGHPSSVFVSSILSQERNVCCGTCLERPPVYGGHFFLFSSTDLNILHV